MLSNNRSTSWLSTGSGLKRHFLIALAALRVLEQLMMSRWGSLLIKGVTHRFSAFRRSTSVCKDDAFAAAVCNIDSGNPANRPHSTPKESAWFYISFAKGVVGIRTYVVIVLA